MANAVAQYVQRIVGRIVPIPNALLVRKTLDRLSRHGKQWSDQHDLWVCRRGISPVHTSQSVHARPAQEADKKQLHLVIGMVRESDFAAPCFSGSTGKKFMPRLP